MQGLRDALKQSRDHGVAIGPFQRIRLGFVEGGTGGRAGAQGSGRGRRVRRRTNVFRRPANRCRGEELAGRVRLPDFSERRSYPFPAERH